MWRSIKMSEEITPEQLDEYIKGLKKEIEEKTKAADLLQGKIANHESQRETWKKEKLDLETLIAENAKAARKELEAKVKAKNKEFKITKDMSDDFLKGYILGSPAENSEKESSPPNIPSGMDGATQTLTEKQLFIQKLLS